MEITPEHSVTVDVHIEHCFGQISVPSRLCSLRKVYRYK